MKKIEYIWLVVLTILALLVAAFLAREMCRGRNDEAVLSKAIKAAAKRDKRCLVQRYGEVVLCSSCGCCVAKDTCTSKKEVRTRRVMKNIAEGGFYLAYVDEDYIHTTYTCKRCSELYGSDGKLKQKGE